MEALPNEIIEYILIDSNISIVDVVNFSSACHKLREIVNSNGSLWKAKYFQRWPKTDFDIECEDWYNECISRRCFEKKVLELLSYMSSKFFNTDLTNIGGLELEFTSSLISSHRYGYYYLRDFLLSINSLPLTQSLTNKYYGNLLLRYTLRKHCKEFWNSLIQLDPKEQTLEKGPMFVSLWCQVYERGIWQTVSSELDATASKIKQHLLHCFPDHPLKNVSEEVCSVWRNENIPGNMFQPQDCKSIIWAINYVLFRELKYCVTFGFNEKDMRSRDIYYALLDRKANLTIFGVIYESISRRLGVKIEVLEFNEHSLVRWREDYSVESSPVHYISTSPEPIFLKPLCSRSRNSSALMPACDMQQIAEEAALCVYPRERHENYFPVWGGLELVLVINPFNLECYQRLYRSCVLKKMDAKELIMKLKDIRSQISSADRRWYDPLLHTFELYQENWESCYSSGSEQGMVVQTRVEGIEFAVGMIVRNKFSGRMGVICGWDLNGCTSQGIRSRNVVYEVLLDDGISIFTPQATLQILHSPPSFFHPSFGRFFDEFCVTYYKPNKELQARYPQEMEALQNILKRDRQN